jgi:Zn-dependent protease with chaperone function
MSSVPSVARRAFVALAVLVAFYVTTIAIALVLLPLPVLVFMGMDHIRPVVLIAVAACCWIPAGLLLSGLLGVRPRRFEEPGLPLQREHAPALFAMLDELARAANTTAPHDVYISTTPEAFVAETGGGFLGSNSRRVLCIGAPLLATSTVGELRAMLAHELGHYLGGDTRLGGVLAFTIGAFRSVLDSTEQDALRAGSIHWSVDLGHAFARGVATQLVKFYAWIYLSLTRPMSRRQELAADALAASLAGRENAIRALQNVHLLDPLYSLYLETEVSRVVGVGAMPTDLLAGFERFRAQIGKHGVVAELETAVHDAKTDPFDTHPALSDRVAALRALPESSGHVLDAPGRTLLDGSFDLDGWLVDATYTSFRRADPKPVPRMPWSEITRVVMPAHAEQSGRKAAAALFTKLPHATTLSAMFAAVVQAFEAGRVVELVETYEPRIHDVPFHQRNELGMALASQMLAALFEAALLEQGAELDESLGDPSLVFRSHGETVRPAIIARDAMKVDAARRELSRWAALLASPATHALAHPAIASSGPVL